VTVQSFHDVPTQRIRDPDCVVDFQTMQSSVSVSTETNFQMVSLDKKSRTGVADLSKFGYTRCSEFIL